MKDLINLTFNVDKFTLIQDVSDMGKVGRTYLLDRDGAIPAHDEADPKYAAIGGICCSQAMAFLRNMGFSSRTVTGPLRNRIKGRLSRNISITSACWSVKSPIRIKRSMYIFPMTGWRSAKQSEGSEPKSRRTAKSSCLTLAPMTAGSFRPSNRFWTPRESMKPIGLRKRSISLPVPKACKSCPQ